MDLSETGHFSDKAQRDYNLVRQAIQKGDQSAYAELMQLYHDAIYYQILKKTGNPEEADDLTIEIFGKAFLNLRQYSPSFAFSTWLFAISSNHHIDYLRKKKESTISIDDTGNSEISLDHQSFQDKNFDPEELFISKEKVLMLRQIIEKLKPRYQTIIELRYFKEYSILEISKELNIQEGTVKVRLFRAREFLYNILHPAQGKA